MNGGKRIRPVLALAFCEMCGGDPSAALAYAAAVEMIHTYSLIHDDLPCMDNDDMRRGKPSCHKQFGEEYALLAGDGLLNLAFETIFGKVMPTVPEVAVACGRVLSSASGSDGMIGGQTIDLESENKTISVQELTKLHALKTGAMIIAPCKIGVICAGGDDFALQRAQAFGEALGLQFQIVDDILDQIGTAEVLGKPIGSDNENHKATYVTLLGMQAARQKAQELTQTALEQLEPFGDKAAFLRELTRRLCERSY